MLCNEIRGTVILRSGSLDQKFLTSYEIGQFITLLTREPKPVNRYHFISLLLYLYIILLYRRN